MSRRIEIKETDWLGLTGYTIVVAFMIIIGITAANKDIDTMKTVAAILGPFAGAIVTFYFGVRKLEQIVRKLEALATK